MSTVSLSEILAAANITRTVKTVAPADDITALVADAPAPHKTRAPRKTATSAPAPVPTPEPTADAPIKYPKATDMRVKGTALKIIRHGYAMLVETSKGTFWVNCSERGLPLFVNVKAGDTVDYTVNGYGYVPSREASKKARNAAIRATKPASERRSAPKTSRPRPSRGGAGCEYCSGPTHAKNDSEDVTIGCLKRQYATETGIPAVADLYEFAKWAHATPRVVFAHNNTGSATFGEAPAKARAPRKARESAPISDKAFKAQIETAVAQEKAAPKRQYADGTYRVMLKKFPTNRTGMVFVHNATDFNGVGKNEGHGMWILDIPEDTYSRLAKVTLGSMLQVTIEAGMLVKANLVTEKKTDAPVTNKRSADMKAKRAAARAAAQANMKKSA